MGTTVRIEKEVSKRVSRLIRQDPYTCNTEHSLCGIARWVRTSGPMLKFR